LYNYYGTRYGSKRRDSVDWSVVGKRIQAAREKAGYTQEELAAELDMSPTHISVLERGVKPPKLETFVRIANTLAVSADTLLQDVVVKSEAGAATSLAEDIMKLPKRERELIVSMIRLTEGTNT
jgi:transcriptional regulator with XRE-family HTH domain